MLLINRYEILACDHHYRLIVAYLDVAFAYQISSVANSNNLNKWMQALKPFKDILYSITKKWA
jgi:hypothetical protein